MSIETQLKNFSHAAGAVQPTESTGTKTAKKPGKKAAAKAATPSKATKTEKADRPASGNGSGRAHFTNNMTITLKSIDGHGFRAGGNGEKAMEAFKDGQTVEQYKVALEKKGIRGYHGWALKTAVERKYIVVKA